MTPELELIELLIQELKNRMNSPIIHDYFLCHLMGPIPCSSRMPPA